MSSYLSKSKKEFKPKVPPRRGTVAAASSPQPPVRASIERTPALFQTTPSVEIQRPSSPQTSTRQISNSPEEAVETTIQEAGQRPLTSSNQQTHVTEVGLSDRINVDADCEQPLPNPENDASTPKAIPNHLTLGPTRGQLQTPLSTQRAPISGPFNPIHPSHGGQEVQTFEHGTHQDNHEASDDIVHHASSQVQLIQRGPKRTRLEQIASEIVEQAIGAGESNGTPAKRSRRRAPTPDGADRIEITPTVITMSELTKDLRQGKTSSREKRLQEKAREQAERRKSEARERARNQAQEFMENPGDIVVTQERGSASASQPSPLPTTAPVKPIARIAPRVRVVNGQIVQDEESRILDRHQVTTETSEEAIEEDELTRHVNSGSYMRRERHTKWTAEETARFYQGLRWFGTDFQTISKMFPGRTRRQIKLKYTKEERNPVQKDAMHRALVDERETADIAQFELYAGLTLPDLKRFEKEMGNDRAELIAAQARETAAMAAMQREREMAAAAEADAHAQAQAATAAKEIGHLGPRPAAEAGRTVISAPEESGPSVPETNHDIAAENNARKMVSQRKRRPTEKAKAAVEEHPSQTSKRKAQPSSPRLPKRNATKVAKSIASKIRSQDVRNRLDQVATEGQQDRIGTSGEEPISELVRLELTQSPRSSGPAKTTLSKVPKAKTRARSFRATNPAVASSSKEKRLAANLEHPVGSQEREETGDTIVVAAAQNVAARPPPHASSSETPVPRDLGNRKNSPGKRNLAGKAKRGVEKAETATKSNEKANGQARNKESASRQGAGRRPKRAAASHGLLSEEMQRQAAETLLRAAG